MSKSSLYAANTAAQALSGGDVISFGSPVRRFGCNLNTSGGNVIASGSGYFEILANVTFTAGAAGVTSIALYKDGTAIPGATAAVTTAAGDTYNLQIPAIVRSCCPCESVITAQIDAAATIDNAAITADKL